MRISNFSSLLLAAMVAGCSGPNDVPAPVPTADLSPPGPILSTDQVKDARTAIHLGVTHCFPQQAEASFQAELQNDRWFVWVDFKNASFSAEVAKSDGAILNCWNIEI